MIEIKIIVEDLTVGVVQCDSQWCRAEILKHAERLCTELQYLVDPESKDSVIVAVVESILIQSGDSYEYYEGKR